MPYVTRDEDGKITAIHKSPTPDAKEQIGPDDPDLVSFLTAGNTVPDSLKWELLVSDLMIGRLTEDLIDVLIEKGVIAFTDLPDAAQRKLVRRKSLRGKLQSVESLVEDKGGVL